MNSDRVQYSKTPLVEFEDSLSDVALGLCATSSVSERSRKGEGEDEAPDESDRLFGGCARRGGIYRSFRRKTPIGAAKSRERIVRYSLNSPNDNTKA